MYSGDCIFEPKQTCTDFSAFSKPNVFGYSLCDDRQMSDPNRSIPFDTTRKPAIPIGIAISSFANPVALQKMTSQSAVQLLNRALEETCSLGMFGQQIQHSAGFQDTSQNRIGRQCSGLDKSIMKFNGSGICSLVSDSVSCRPSSLPSDPLWGKTTDLIIFRQIHSI
jgi:hypothetical protein